jgi:hypothetical protein
LVAVAWTGAVEVPPEFITQHEGDVSRRLACEVTAADRKMATPDSESTMDPASKRAEVDLSLRVLVPGVEGVGDPVGIGC